MSALSLKKTVGVLFAALIGALALAATADGAPIKLRLSGHICAPVSEPTCQPGLASAVPGGFEYPRGVAGTPEGNVYVADSANHRVQELSSSGEFVLMFGQEVNETKTNAIKAKGGTPTRAEVEEEDLCTQEEIVTAGVKCKKGVEGGAAGSLAFPESIVFDPIAKVVYVEDFLDWRVDEFTADGKFLWTVGKEVNPKGLTSEEKNICTGLQECATGVHGEPGPKEEEAAFNVPLDPGDVMAVDPSSDALYVGDDQRLQEIDSNGKLLRAVKLPNSITSTWTLHQSPTLGGEVTALAVRDNKAYVVFDHQPRVYELNLASDLVENTFVISTEEEAKIRAMAIDEQGRLAVMANESPQKNSALFGVLMEASTGHVLSRITVPGTAVLGVTQLGLTDGVGFGAGDTLYAAAVFLHEIQRYEAVKIGELLPGTVPPSCQAGALQPGSFDDTYTCHLTGEVNPYEVPETEVWFEWGHSCALGSDTANQPVDTIEAPIAVSDQVEGLRPNEGICYRLAGDDRNAPRSEMLFDETQSVSTPSVQPVAIGAPTASEIRAFAAVLHGEVNPENSPTEYFFEYAPASSAALHECAGVTKLTGCRGVSVTGVIESHLYGRTKATLEAPDLQPGTEYDYRLALRREGGEKLLLLGAEGQFTTVAATVLPAPEWPPAASAGPAPAPPAFPLAAPVQLLSAPAIAFPAQQEGKAPAKHGKHKRRNRRGKRPRMQVRHARGSARTSAKRR